MHKPITLSVLILGVAALFLEQLPSLVPWLSAVTNAIDFLILGLSLLDLALDLRRASYRFIYIRRNWFSILFLGLFTVFFGISKWLFFTGRGASFGGVAGLIVFRNSFLLLKIFSRFRKLTDFLKSLVTTPAQTFVTSFLLVIFAGALLLSMEPAAAPGKSVSVLDALFTATSAVCVTGLAVVDTASSFSLWGKIVLLSLIQIGGLGIMILSFSALFMFRRAFSLENRLMASFLVNDDALDKVGAMVARIVLSTFAIEGIGAVLLYASFPSRGLEAGPRAFNALFHSVSAFCNAGFSLYSDSLETSGNPAVLVVVGSLIILGGLSFSAIFDLLDRISPNSAVRSRPLKVNTRIVLRYTAVLVVLGTLLVYFFEHGNSMRDQSVGVQYLNALFQSVTLRTAGFNSISFGSLSRPALLIMMAFMFIGGASGSTAGGIKVNTLGVMAAAARSLSRHGEEPVLYGHRLSPSLVTRAFLLFVAGIVIVLLGLFALFLTEKADSLSLAFEAVSAFGTVGLSTGVTPTLSGPGKLVIMVLMFFGRVGPLTVVSAAILANRRAPSTGYPEADVSIG